MTVAEGERAQAAKTGKPGALTVQAKVAIAVVTAVAAVALFWPRGDGTHKAPGGFLYDPDGRPATLGERLAPVTLLHFWATWCPPCLDELPSLTRLGADAASDDFAILMVAVFDDTARAASFLGNRAASALYDPNWDVAHRYGTYQLPETYLLVDNRVVEVAANVDRFVGAQDWDDPALRRRLEEAIRQHRPPGISFSPAGSSR